MKNSLSNLQANKVGVHDNSHHTEEYATVELLSKEISKLKIDRNEIQGYINGIVNLYDALEEKINRIKNDVIDWSKPQDITIHNNNIEFPVYNHNKLKEYEPKEHIDWTKEQSLNIHIKNIPKLDISNYFNEIEHNKLKGYSKNAHIDWTKEQDKKIHHRNVFLSGIDHNTLKNYSDSNHINHNEVSIFAGKGLKGGGTISTNRTIELLPADKNQLGGIKIGDGLSIDEKTKRINVDLKQEEFQIDNIEWKSAGKRGLYQVIISHNIGKELINITCMDLDTGIIIYPKIQIIDKGIFKVFSEDKKASMLIKIIG